MTTTAAQPQAVTVTAEYGDLWKLYSNGEIHRAGHCVASFDRGTGTLLWETRELSRAYRGPVIRLLNEAKCKVETILARDLDMTQAPEGAPPRPAMHPDYGIYTPSLVRWRHKFAPAEFELVYGVIDMSEAARVTRDILRKDLYPEYQSRWGEDQPHPREVTWLKPGGVPEKLVFDNHRKGDPIPPHLWRCYGNEVVGTERKYPAMCDTVLTFATVTGGGDAEMTRTTDPNLTY